jgi:hypothetical protein
MERRSLWTFSCCLLLTAFISLPVHGAPSTGTHGLEFGPENVAVLAGEDVVLRCRTDGVPNTNVRWFEFSTSSTGAMLSDGELILPTHPNSARYTIIHSDSVTYDLRISPTIWEDGAYYYCADSNGAPPSIVQLGAQLVIIDANPNCTTQIPTDGFVIEGQYYTNECQVRFKASPGIAPIMTWTGPDPFNSGSRTTNDTVASAMEFTVERSMDAQNYRCKTNFTTAGFIAPDSAANAPTWSHQYNGNQMFAHWAPTNITAWPIQAAYEIGDTVTCWADANPTAVYQWQSLRTSEFWYAATFETREDMVGYQLMRCTARNSMQGYDYTKDLFVDVYVNAKTTTAAPTTPSTTTPVPAVAPCNDLTGRWEAVNPNASLCLTVDHANDARLLGLYLNASNTYWLQLTGRTREGKYDESGWALIWPSTSVGVSSFAAECHACYGDETMLANSISRTTKDSAFCAGGNNVFGSPQYTFKRVPTSWPCSSSLAEMQKNIELAAAQRLVREPTRLI